MTILKNSTLEGHLAGSIKRTWDSWLWGPVFEPHICCRDCLNETLKIILLGSRVWVCMYINDDYGTKDGELQ